MFSRLKRVDPGRVAPIPSFDRVAITSVITLAICGAGPINRTRCERFEPSGFPAPALGYGAIGFPACHDCPGDSCRLVRQRDGGDHGGFADQ